MPRLTASIEGRRRPTLTRKEANQPDNGDGPPGTFRPGFVAQREADRVPAVNRDERQREHRHRHRNRLELKERERESGWLSVIVWANRN